MRGIKSRSIGLVSRDIEDIGPFKTRLRDISQSLFNIYILSRKRFYRCMYQLYYSSYKKDDIISRTRKLRNISRRLRPLSRMINLNIFFGG